MKDSKFLREIGDLIYYIREYGVQHLSYELEIDALRKEAWKREEFYTQVHHGFSLAQDRVIFLLSKILMEQKKLKAEMSEIRRQRNKTRETEVNALLNHVKYQELVLRKVMDAIAFQIFRYDLSTMRRLYCGNEPIDITDSNLKSEIRFSQQFVAEHPGAFVLISDLTSFIQIGDAVALTPGEGIKIIELKEGAVNEKVFDLIRESAEIGCPRYFQLRMEEENQNFQKQMKRSIKQLYKSAEAMKAIKDGQGTDLLTGLEVHIAQDEIEMDTFAGVVYNLSKDCVKKGYAISVIEDCLLVGMYETEKFPSAVFDIWAKEMQIQMPVYDLRMSFGDPLSYPVYLHSFSDHVLLDLISGKKTLKMTLAIDKWLDTFKSEGYMVRWLSKKETARINSKLKGSSKIFDLDGSGVEIEKDDIKFTIGPAIFSRMFTHFNTPSSVKKLLTTQIQYTGEELM